MLTPLPELLADAISGGYAVGYFEAWDSYSLEAVIEAAEAERSPIIAGFGCMMTEPEWMTRVGIASFGQIGLAAAERCSCPASLILNEARSLRQAHMGIDAGFTVVMLDTSRWAVSDARRDVAALIAIAHARGVSVEAEVGSLPDAHGEVIDSSQAVLTDPVEAARFAKETGVDCLAVSIGNIHLMSHGSAPVELDRLKEIRKLVHVPLVLHGGTGFPASAVRDAIALGVAKFNVGTALKIAFLAGMRDALGKAADTSDVHALVGSHSDVDVMVAGKARMRDTVREFMRLYGSSGKAASS